MGEDAGLAPFAVNFLTCDTVAQPSNQVLPVLEMRQTEGHGLRALRLRGQPNR